MEEDDFAIHKACRDRNIVLVQQLLSQDPSLTNSKNPKDGNLTPLHWACYELDAKIIKLLLEMGAHVNEPDAIFNTPLHCLLFALDEAKYEEEDEEMFEALEILLEAGADPNARGYKGETPWCAYFFIHTLDARVLKMLLQHGMDITIKDQPCGSTAIRLFCKVGNVDCAKVCLEHGADVNEIDEKFGTLAHTVLNAEDFHEEKIFGTLVFLFDNGFSLINHTIKSNGKTALVLAARNGDLDSVRYLLSHGARADLCQPLDFLSNEVFYDDTFKSVWVNFIIAKVLIQHGANLDPLYWHGEETINRLINPGPDKVKVEAARKILVIILQENALKIPNNIPTQLDLDYSTQAVLQSQIFEMIPHLYQLGYTVEQIEDLPNETKPQYAKEKLLSLQSHCRIVLRSMLGCPLSGVVKNLPMTEVMKDYLLMTDIGEL